MIAQADTIAADNELGLTFERLMGLNETTGERELVHTADLEAYITLAPESDTKLAAITIDVPEIDDSGDYLILFPGDDVTAILSAAGLAKYVYLVLTDTDGKLRIVKGLRVVPARYG